MILDNSTSNICYCCAMLQQLDMWKSETMLHCQVTIYPISTLIYYLVSFTAPQTLTKSHNMFLLPRPAPRHKPPLICQEKLLGRQLCECWAAGTGGTL